MSLMLYSPYENQIIYSEVIIYLYGGHLTQRESDDGTQSIFLVWTFTRLNWLP